MVVFFRVAYPVSSHGRARPGPAGLLFALLACAVMGACGLNTQAQGSGAGAGGAAGNAGGDAAPDVAQSCLPTPGQKQCGTQCVEQTDPGYGCSDPSCTPCSLPHATPTCTAGACAIDSCDAGYSDCNGDPTDGCEISTDADPNHCGDCATDCGALDPSKQWECNSGKCALVCSAGLGDCNGVPSDACETDLQTSTPNCGACGRACSQQNGYTTSCSGGLCSTSCNFGWGDCTQPPAPAPDDGCESNLQSDAAHCGACGAPCSTSHSASQTCTNGACSHSCQSGWADCNGYQPGTSDDGCETQVGTDPDHCGNCYRICSTAQVASRSCQGGVCNSTCKPDWGNCRKPPAPQGDDGCETYLQSAQNCGGCGRSCSNAHSYGQSCSKSLCVHTCEPGWADCSSPAAPKADDGCECQGKCAGGKCQP